MHACPPVNNIDPFKASTQEREPKQVSISLSTLRRASRLTIAVLVGIYTCVKFFRPFHSNGVVKNLVPASIRSKPPYSLLSVFNTTLYVPLCSTPTR